MKEEWISVGRWLKTGEAIYRWADTEKYAVERDHAYLVEPTPTEMSEITRSTDDIIGDIETAIDNILLNSDGFRDTLLDICKSKREKTGIHRERIPSGE